MPTVASLPLRGCVLVCLSLPVLFLFTGLTSGRQRSISMVFTIFWKEGLSSLVHCLFLVNVRISLWASSKKNPVEISIGVAWNLQKNLGRINIFSSSHVIHFHLSSSASFSLLNYNNVINYNKYSNNLIYPVVYGSWTFLKFIARHFAFFCFYHAWILLHCISVCFVWVKENTYYIFFLVFLVFFSCLVLYCKVDIYMNCEFERFYLFFTNTYTSDSFLRFIG